MAEIWDIYNIDRQLTGRTGIRGEALEQGEYHLVVFAFIINKNNEILISKRSLNKTFPGCWEITGGSAVTGDTSEVAILREIKEELGVDVSLENGHLIKTHIGESYASYFADTYIFFEDIQIEDVVCQVEEVSEAKYVSIEEFFNMLEKDMFTSNLFIYKPLYQVIVESYFYSWLQNDFNRFRNLLHPNIKVEECTGDTYIGSKACEDWFKTWNQVGNRVLNWKISNTISGKLNSEIIVEWSFTCEFDYKTYSFDGCSIFAFEDHKIIGLKEFQMDTNKKFPYNKDLNE